jgi:hypothetical protein
VLSASPSADGPDWLYATDWGTTERAITAFGEYRNPPAPAKPAPQVRADPLVHGPATDVPHPAERLATELDEPADPRPPAR